MPIELKNVTYTYMKGTPFERTALKDVSLTIADGSLTAIAGHTGSGKSTLVQHLNGILHPTAGEVLVDGVSLAGKGKENLLARRQVGMVFQYPEQQLFEETVAADIAFGPKNLELSDEEIERRVQSAMEFVQLDYETYKDVLEDIARMAERVVFMHDGRILVDAPPSEAFFADKEMREAGLAAPPTVALLSRLRD